MAAYAADVRACFDKPLACPWENLKGGLVLGDQSLWDKARRLLSGRQPETQTRPWLKRDTQADISRRVADLIDAEKDPRVRTWARVRLAGEPQASLARELGYADASGVHRVAARLEARAKTDPKLQTRLRWLREELSNVNV